MPTLGEALAHTAKQMEASRLQAEKRRDVLAMHGENMLNVLRYVRGNISSADKETLNNVSQSVRMVLDAVEGDLGR